VKCRGKVTSYPVAQKVNILKIWNKNEKRFYFNWAPSCCRHHRYSSCSRFSCL